MDFDPQDPESWRIKPSQIQSGEWVVSPFDTDSELLHWCMRGGTLNDFFKAQTESERMVLLANSILAKP